MEAVRTFDIAVDASGCKNVIKGTVRVISCDPQCKDGNARFKMVPLKP